MTEDRVFTDVEILHIRQANAKHGRLPEEVIKTLVETKKLPESDDPKKMLYHIERLLKQGLSLARQEAAEWERKMRRPLAYGELLNILKNYVDARDFQIFRERNFDSFVKAMFVLTVTLKRKGIITEEELEETRLMINAEQEAVKKQAEGEGDTNEEDDTEADRTGRGFQHSDNGRTEPDAGTDHKAPDGQDPRGEGGDTSPEASQDGGAGREGSDGAEKETVGDSSK